jgi:hypothetical protein
MYFHVISTSVLQMNRIHCKEREIQLTSANAARGGERQRIFTLEEPEGWLTKKKLNKLGSYPKNAIVV